MNLLRDRIRRKASRLQQKRKWPCFIKSPKLWPRNRTERLAIHLPMQSPSSFPNPRHCSSGWKRSTILITLGSLARLLSTATLRARCCDYPSLIPVASPVTVASRLYPRYCRAERISFRHDWQVRPRAAPVRPLALRKVRCLCFALPTARPSDCRPQRGAARVWDRFRGGDHTPAG